MRTHVGLKGQHISLTVDSTIREVKARQCFPNVPLWVYETGDHRYNPLFYVKINGEHGVLAGCTKSSGRSIGVFPKREGEYFRMDGHAQQSAGIIVYSESEPQLQVGDFLNPLAWIDDCHGCTFDIRGSHAGQGVVVKNSTDCTIRLRGHDFGEGVTVMGRSRRITVHNSQIDHVCKVPIRFTSSVSDCLAEYNACEDSGMIESVAGIYLTGNNCVARSNFISRVHYGNLWPHDGAGIFTENYSERNFVIGNTVTDCHIAYKDNSGAPGNRFYNNRAINCIHAIKQSDSKRVGKADTIFRGTEGV